MNEKCEIAPETDEALMARYQAGDMEAFHQLYHRYEKKLYNYLLKSVGDAEKSADLFSD